MRARNLLAVRSAVRSRLAVAAVASLLVLTASSASAAAAESPTPDHDIVAIDDLGFHDLPVTWFADTVVVPGDRSVRSLVIRNDRAEPTRVSVDLNDVRPADGQLIDGLTLAWDDIALDGDVLALSGASVVEPVLLAPGEAVSLSLGYVYEPPTQTAPASPASLTFTLSFRATAGTTDGPGSGDDGPDGSGAGAGSGGGTGSGGGADDPLASTGGRLLDLRVPLALLGGGLLLAVWGRRRRRAEHGA